MTAVMRVVLLSLLTLLVAACAHSTETLSGLSAVPAGEWAEATLLSADSAWTTRKIDLKGKQRTNEWIVTGPLARAADGTLAILGVPFMTNDATATKDTSGANVSVASLRAGDVVEARIAQDGARYVARKLRLRAPTAPPEVEGTIESVDASSIRILGRNIGVVTERLRVRRLEQRVQPVRLADDDDLLPGEERRFGPFAVAAALAVDTRDQRNYDLDGTLARNRTDTEPTVRTEIAGVLTPRLRSFVKVSAARRIILSDQRGTRVGFSRVQLSEAYLLFLGVGRPNVALQVGRQRMDEAHEWLYDEELDGVRLHWVGARLAGEASLTTRIDSLRNDAVNTWNTLLTITAAPSSRVSLGAYALHRAPRAADTGTSLWWYGLRLVSLKSGNLRGWGDVAIVRGEDGGLSVRGHGHHFSASYQLAKSGRVTLNGAWARGSGDVTLSDGVNNAFRQSGFNDNNDRFGGVTGFRYYGELTRPNLSNLSVVTLGLGARPVTGASVDLLLHMYHQPVASPLFDSSLDMRPSSLSASLGREADLVVGIRSIRRAKVEFVLARFWAGDAFPTSEHATTGRLQVEVGL